METNLSQSQIIEEKQNDSNKKQQNNSENNKQTKWEENSQENSLTQSALQQELAETENKKTTVNLAKNQKIEQRSGKKNQQRCFNQFCRLTIQNISYTCKKAKINNIRLNATVYYCNECYERWKNGCYCYYCNTIYYETNEYGDGEEWIQCTFCKTWHHILCEERYGEIKNIQQLLKDDDDYQYKCVNCRDKAAQKMKKSKNVPGRKKGHKKLSLQELQKGMQDAKKRNKRANLYTFTKNSSIITNNNNNNNINNNNNNNNTGNNNTNININQAEEENIQLENCINNNYLKNTNIGNILNVNTATNHSQNKLSKNRHQQGKYCDEQYNELPQVNKKQKNTYVQPPKVPVQQLYLKLEDLLQSQNLKLCFSDEYIQSDLNKMKSVVFSSYPNSQENNQQSSSSPISQGKQFQPNNNQKNDSQLQFLPQLHQISSRQQSFQLQKESNQPSHPTHLNQHSQHGHNTQNNKQEQKKRDHSISMEIGPKENYRKLSQVQLQINGDEKIKLSNNDGTNQSQPNQEDHERCNSPNSDSYKKIPKNQRKQSNSANKNK